MNTLTPRLRFTSNFIDGLSGFPAIEDRRTRCETEAGHGGEVEAFLIEEEVTQ